MGAAKQSEAMRYIMISLLRSSGRALRRIRFLSPALSSPLVGALALFVSQHFEDGKRQPEQDARGLQSESSCRPLRIRGKRWPRAKWRSSGLAVVKEAQCY